MNRRNFLRNLIGGVAATAAVRTWPFRVYSFPSEITVYNFSELPWPAGKAIYLENFIYEIPVWSLDAYDIRPLSAVRNIRCPIRIIETPPVPKGNLTAMQ